MTLALLLCCCLLLTFSYCYYYLSLLFFKTGNYFTVARGELVRQVLVFGLDPRTAVDASEAVSEPYVRWIPNLGLYMNGN